MCANDHIGHGKAVASADDLGHMPLEKGEEVLLHDVNALRELVMRRLREDSGSSGDLPYIILDILWAALSRASTLRGTPLAFAPRDLRHRSATARALGCGQGLDPRYRPFARRAIRQRAGRWHGRGAYGKAIEGARTDVDWIATDPEVVDEYRRDPLCGQKFTVGATTRCRRWWRTRPIPSLSRAFPTRCPSSLSPAQRTGGGLRCGRRARSPDVSPRRHGARRCEDLSPRRMRSLNEPIKGPGV